MKRISTFCGKDCGGGACPLLATVTDGKVTRLTNNPAGGKYLKGCVRGFGLTWETYDEKRILHPQIRTGARGSGQFRQVSWEEAIHVTAENLNSIRAQYGATAVMNGASAGSLGALHSTPVLLSRFLSLFGGYTKLTGSYSNMAAKFILPYLFGSDWKHSGFDASTMQNAEMIILWGANLLETRQGPDVPQRLVEAKKRGAQIVVIDPRRTSTVKHLANWWLPVRPGTDAALMLAILHVLFAENLANRDAIHAYSTGFDELEAYILGQACTPKWAEEICGVPAAEIVRFARAYAAARPTMLFPGYSIQRVFAGEETYRLSVALQIATGNFGKRGGSTGSINNLLPGVNVGQLTIPDCDNIAEVPVTLWADAILQGQAGNYPTDIHALYLMGSNLLNQGGDIHKNIAAFKKLDFVVTHELFMTPTAKWSDVIFPAASSLEQEDIGIPWHGHYLLYKPQVVEPLGEARSDYDALSAIASRMGFAELFTEGHSAAEWIEYFIANSDIPDAKRFCETGIYRPEDPERSGLSAFVTNPVDFPLDTPSGKVEIASTRYQDETGFPAIPMWQEPPYDARFPLRLITPKSAFRTHSQGSSVDKLHKKKEHVLEIHPQDALPRNIADGDIVYLYNDRGISKVTARLTDDIVPGVLSLIEGQWVELDEQGVDQAGSANMLVSAEGTYPGRAPIMHAVGVEISNEIPEISQHFP